MPITFSRLSTYLPALLAVAVLAACGGGASTSTGEPGQALRPAPLVTPAIWESQLPAVPTGAADTVRTGSAAQQAAVQGSNAFMQSSGAQANGNMMTVTAGTGALEYALYQFATGNAPQQLTVNASPTQAGMQYWLALANYAALKWELSGPHTSAQVINMAALNGNYLSGGGNVYAAVLAYNGNTVQISDAVAGYDDGQPGGAEYLNDLQPLLAAHCTTCHGSGSFTGVDLHAFWAVRQNQGLLVAQVVNGSHGSLDQTAKDTVQSFVDGGGPYGQAVTYTTDITPLVNNRCSPCHIASSSGGVNWSTYANAFPNGENGLTQILSENMPASGGPLTDAQKDIWQAWVDQGKQE